MAAAGHKTCRPAGSRSPGFRSFRLGRPFLFSAVGSLPSAVSHLSEGTLVFPLDLMHDMGMGYKLSNGDRHALAIFNQLKTAREKAGDGAQMTPMLGADPLTGEQNYDLKKADPACPLCNGKGYRAQLFASGGEVNQLTIICRCVSRRGGIREGALPKSESNHGSNS